MRVILGLQVDERLRAEPDRLIQHGDVEIRYPDVACEALPLRLGQRRDGLAERDCRVGPMHQQKIDEVDAQISQALLDRAREIVGAQIFMRDLGGEEDVAAWHARGTHPFADAALGTVFPSGVDVAIPDLERGRDELAAITQGGGAKADRGYLGAVRRQCGNGRGGHELGTRKLESALYGPCAKRQSPPLRGNTRGRANIDCWWRLSRFVLRRSHS